MTVVRLILLALFIALAVVLRFGVHAFVDTFGYEIIYVIGVPLMLWGFYHEWQHNRRINDSSER